MRSLREKERAKVETEMSGQDGIVKMQTSLTMCR